MALTVPLPTLSQEGVTGARLKADQPIKLACGPVTFPSGAPLTLENVVKFGFLLYRQTGGANEAWNEETKRWVPESPAPDPQPLFYQEDKWQSILVAVGQKDQANQNKFGTNPLTGLPKYFVRCFFRGKDATGREHAGESVASAAVEVIESSEQIKGGLTMNPRDAAAATEVRLFLKDAGLLAEQGKILIREAGGGFEIELSTASGAKVMITNSGEIQLNPASGQIVHINGNVMVDGDITADNFP